LAGKTCCGWRWRLIRRFSVPRPIASGQLLASVQKGLRRDMIAEFTALARQINAVITGAAGPDGKIPKRQRETVKAQARELVERFFVGFARAPFAADGVTAQSTYANILNKWYVNAVTKAVRAHQTWMRATIPADVYNWLAGVPSRPVPVKVQERENPFLRREDETDEEYRRRLDGLRIFRPNPLAEYDPMHYWVDPNGRRLSDRIWRTADWTRDELNRAIASAIDESMGALRLSRLIEQFLIPGRAAVRTTRPYGTDASAYAMRLARTEIARAFNQAAYIAAYTNPYTRGVDWALSPSHPKVDICDSYATIGMSGTRLREPYPFESAQVPPAHPHCLCRTQAAIRDDIVGVTQGLRAAMQDAQNELLTPVLSPAQSDEFIRTLVGDSLFRLVPQAA
jgi:hypothetical protein